MLEFCAPIEREPRFMEVQAWFQDHESKIMAYLQTAITMLAGILAKWIVQGKSSANSMQNGLNTLQNGQKKSIYTKKTSIFLLSQSLTQTLAEVPNDKMEPGDRCPLL